MPHFPHTPEALLGRNDSKNPATTCKGITSSGRPCRRALASPKSSPTSRRRGDSSALGGVIALIQEDGEIQEADFYCWQHKEQAEERLEQEKREDKNGNRGKSVKRRSTELFPLQERSSIDTLVQRLGIDAASESPTQPIRKHRKDANPAPPRRTETNDFATQRLSQAPYAEKYDFVPPSRRHPKPRKRSFWASLCCISGGDDDYVEIVRHKKRVEQARPPETTTSKPTGPEMASNWNLMSTTKPTSASVPNRRLVTANVPIRSAPQRHALSNSQTIQLLSLIPQHLSPQTISTLLNDLTKPISPHDEEGYIYIFWLTPQTNTAPPESTARSLLAPNNGRPQHDRRISDVMTEYSYDGNEQANPDTMRGKKTIMLKIGRAKNITRRMNEWQRQCGYALNLVRWYPYVPSSAAPSPQPSPHRQTLYPDLTRPPTQRRESDAVRKVPCVKRVERLIHLELAGSQVKRQCGACGKEHREWFEVEASQAGVKGVDETVRRWVGWAERCVGLDV